MYSIICSHDRSNLTHIFFYYFFLLLMAKNTNSTGMSEDRFPKACELMDSGLHGNLC